MFLLSLSCDFGTKMFVLWGDITFRKASCAAQSKAAPDTTVQTVLTSAYGYTIDLARRVSRAHICLGKHSCCEARNYYTLLLPRKLQERRSSVTIPNHLQNHKAPLGYTKVNADAVWERSCKIQSPAKR